MSRTAGAKLGSYEIISQLGAGGMGEVYRARDAGLGGDVAIKILPSSFSRDPDRLRRFEQEARAAALNHGGHARYWTVRARSPGYFVFGRDRRSSSEVATQVFARHSAPSVGKPMPSFPSGGETLGGLPAWTSSLSSAKKWPTSPSYSLPSGFKSPSRHWFTLPPLEKM
jgi:hypothetical protein